MQPVQSLWRQKGLFTVYAQNSNQLDPFASEVMYVIVSHKAVSLGSLSVFDTMYSSYIAFVLGHFE